MGMGPVRDGATAGRGEFEHDAKPAQIAYELRVSTKSVYQWRAGGREAGRSGLSAVAGVAGPAAGGYEAGPDGVRLDDDHLWTLAAGHDANRAAVPCPVHAARYVVPAASDRVQPAGARASGCGARRGRSHRLACRDLGEGARQAAATMIMASSSGRPSSPSLLRDQPSWTSRMVTVTAPSSVTADAGAASQRRIRSGQGPTRWRS